MEVFKKLFQKFRLYCQHRPFLIPRTIQELVGVLDACIRHHVIDRDTMSMMEGVIRVATTQVRDIMVPRAQMISIDEDVELEDLLKYINLHRYSRFPVTGKHRDDVRGILLARDLLPWLAPNGKMFALDAILHSAMFVPESMRIDNLLEEFQRKHTHMAIVVDEYGGIAGLVTIEDILEEIVGEIEDEHFIDPSTEAIEQKSSHCYVVQGLTEIEELSKLIPIRINDADSDTIGGYVAKHFGTIPNAGDQITIDGVSYRIISTEKRRIRQLELTLPTS